MNTNREKTSSVMGLVVSVLLHAIFIAGCFALDASSAIKSSTQDKQSTEVNSATAQADHAKPHS